ncbi:MAG: GntR family transcriptional regulator [Pseudomonadota bacterium]|nr:GntR family transcriptional regulator [Pseudomonadota bacterium]
MAQPKLSLVRTSAARPSGLSLAERCYAELKRRIVANELPPNFKALEPELALMLRMSRTPVREALMRLENEGLIERVARRGMRVLPVAPADMIEIYQILTGLEGAAVELLAEKEMSDAEIRRLDATIAAMEAALSSENLTAWATADEQFHRTLIELSGNRRLAQIAFAFREQVGRVRLQTLPARVKPVRSTAAHKELVKLIKRGEATGARELHWRQRRRSAAELTEILKRSVIREP